MKQPENVARGYKAYVFSFHHRQKKTGCKLEHWTKANARFIAPSKTATFPAKAASTPERHSSALSPTKRKASKAIRRDMMRMSRED